MAGRFKLSDALLLVAAWIVMIALVNPVANFPQNDDWVYALTVESILKNGRFEVLDMTSANFGPQAYWGALFAWLFGFSYTSLRFSTIVLGVVGIIALYALALEVWQERRIALVLALGLMVNPVFFALSNTFMTDIPFLVLLIVSMLAIAAGIRRERTELLIVGLAVAILDVLLRQVAVVVLAGFAFAFIARNGTRPRTLMVALVPLFLGLLLHYLFSLWLVDSGRKPMPPEHRSFFSFTLSTYFWTIRHTVFVTQSYVGFFLMPLVILCLPRARDVRGDRPAWRLPGAIVVASFLIGAFYVLIGSLVPVGGNTFDADGVGPLLIADTINQRNLPEPTVFSSLSWKAITSVTIASSACLFVALGICGVRGAGILRENAPSKPLGFVQGAFFAGTAGAYLAVLLLMALLYPVFDRYLLPLTVLAGLVAPFLISRGSLRSEPGNVPWVTALVVIAAMACFSVVSTHDFMRWGDMRWRVLNALVARGIPPQKIDGGYEFNGTYLYDLKYRVVKPKSWWWVADDEYLIASGPVPGYREIERVPVDRWWKSAGRDVFVLHRIAPTAGASQ